VAGAVTAIPTIPEAVIDAEKLFGFINNYSRADTDIMKTLGVINKVGQINPQTISKVVTMVDIVNGANSVSAVGGIEGVVNSVESLGRPSNFVQMSSGLEKEVIVPETISNVAKIGEAAGKITGAIGAVTSGVGLGFDIANAVKDKKVTFDNAMNIADDATGLVSAAVGFIPVVGVPLSIGLTAGEKVVTGIIKGAKAVKEEKEAEGVKHLKPGVWLDTVVKANTPAWMTADIGEAYRNYKKNKPAIKTQKKAEKVQRQEEWKSMSGKDKAKRFFLG
jgi:hypothetical protein